MTYLILGGFLLFHLILLSKLYFTAWPEMLSYPYLLSKEFLLYKDFVAPYTPGLIMLLSGIYNIFGFNVYVLKNFTWIILLLTDIVIFLIFKKLTGTLLSSFFFLVVYIFLASFLDGNMTWFDNATVLPLLMAIYLGLLWIYEKKLSYLFLIGFTFAVTILIKQIAIVYLLAFVLFYIYKRNGIVIKEVIISAAGIIIPSIPFIFYLLKNNIFKHFLDITLIFPLNYWSDFPGYVDLDTSKKEILIASFLISFSLASLFKFKKLIKNDTFIFLILTQIAAVLAIYPRFSYFHLQPSLAISLVLMANIFKFMTNKFKKIFAMYLIVVCMAIFLLVGMNSLGVDIRYYGEGDRKLTKQLLERLKGEKKTYFFGINSTQYIFTQTLPAKPWVEGFGWYMETPGMQEKVIKGLEHEKINTIFLRKPAKGNWYALDVYQPQKIVRYIHNTYLLTSTIDENIEVWRRKE